MDMPVVQSCAAESCAYNRDQTCHAWAITIGDAQMAACDTFFGIPRKGGAPTPAGQVGACKMDDCTYNVDLECQAPGISVGRTRDSAECMTYQRS